MNVGARGCGGGREREREQAGSDAAMAASRRRRTAAGASRLPRSRLPMAAPAMGSVRAASCPPSRYKARRPRPCGAAPGGGRAFSATSGMNVRAEGALVAHGASARRKASVPERSAPRGSQHVSRPWCSVETPCSAKKHTHTHKKNTGSPEAERVKHRGLAQVVKRRQVVEQGPRKCGGQGSKRRRAGLRSNEKAHREQGWASARNRGIERRTS